MELKKQLLYLYKVSRPELWHFLYGAAYIGVLAAMREHTQWYYLLQPKRFYLFLALTVYMVMFNFTVYATNDLTDYATDLLNKQRVNELVGPEQSVMVIRVIIVTQILASIAMYLAGGVKGLIVCAICWAMNIAYSVPPLRCKARPGLDLVCDGAGYLLPGILGYWLFFGMPSLYAWRLIVCGFFFVAGCHMLASVRDIPADKQAGVRSTGVAIGTQRGVQLAQVVFAVSVIAWLFVAQGMALLLVMVPLLHLILATWVGNSVSGGDTLPEVVSGQIYVWIWRFSWWGGIVCTYQALAILGPPFLGWAHSIGW